MEPFRLPFLVAVVSERTRVMPTVMSIMSFMTFMTFVTLRFVNVANDQIASQASHRVASHRIDRQTERGGHGVQKGKSKGEE